MRFLSLKILVLCILIPPVLYIASAYFLERHFQARFTREIEEIYTGFDRPVGRPHHLHFGYLTPPVAAELPASEAEPRQFDVQTGHVAVLYGHTIR